MSGINSSKKYSKLHGNPTSIFARCLDTVINVHFTILSRETRLTNAKVSIHSISTYSSILTWTAATFIVVYFTQTSCVAWFASTGESIHSVSTSATVTTRQNCTVINISLTELSHKACLAMAVEIRDKILTSCSILARVTLTVINICLADDSSISSVTFTAKGVYLKIKNQYIKLHKDHSTCGINNLRHLITTDLCKMMTLQSKQISHCGFQFSHYHEMPKIPN